MLGRVHAHLPLHALLQAFLSRAFNSFSCWLVLLQVSLPEDPTGAQRFTKRDASLALRPSEAGVVDQVLLTTSEGGQTFVKVRVRSICIPQVRA